MTLELSYGMARITEPDLELLPAGAYDIPDVVNLGGGERRDGVVTGVRALLLALLEDSVRCYLGDKAALRREAERWIEGRQRGAAVTFEAVCSSFGLDPSATRRHLRRLRLAQADPRQMGRARPNVRHTAVLALRRRRRKRRHGAAAESEPLASPAVPPPAESVGSEARGALTSPLPPA
ncbi:MAG TPA: hypothetical protein VEB21_04080 [Terriglobales bacterium]|nr:hypothetical protein [Terriglobales bacterium]